MPGVTRLHLMADDLAQRSRLFRRTDQAVDAEHLRLLGAGLDQIGHAEAIARRVKIAVVIGGQHGDGEDLQVRSRARLDRRLHGLRIGVHGEECRAERCDALDAARHGVADVVQLEIDEDLLAGAGELADQRQSAGISRADSRSCRTSRCRRAARSSLPRRRRSGRSSATISRSRGAILVWLHVTSHHALGNFDQLPHQRLQRLDIGRMLQPVHIVIGLARRTTARAGSE